MALIIDDGSLELGDSFVTIDEADTYHRLRGNKEWAKLSIPSKEAVLIRAFDFLSIQNWSAGVFGTAIPAKVKQAQCLGALKESITPGSLQPDVETGIKSKSIDGVLATSYFAGGSGTINTAIENLIRGYIATPGVKTRLVRG